MTNAEKVKVTRILSAYLKMYPNTKADSDTIVLYVHALDAFRPSQIAAAMDYLAQRVKFYPCPAEIIEAIEKLDERVRGTDGRAWGDAWEEVQQYIRKVGPMNSRAKAAWQWQNPDAEAAARRFGWQDLYYLETEHVGTARAQFRQIYEAVRREQKEKRATERTLKRFSWDVKKLFADTATRLSLPEKDE